MDDNHEDNRDEARHNAKSAEKRNSVADAKTTPLPAWLRTSIQPPGLGATSSKRIEETKPAPGWAVLDKAELADTSSESASVMQRNSIDTIERIVGTVGGRTGADRQAVKRLWWQSPFLADFLANSDSVAGQSLDLCSITAALSALSTDSGENQKIEPLNLLMLSLWCQSYGEFDAALHFHELASVVIDGEERPAESLLCLRSSLHDLLRPNSEESQQPAAIDVQAEELRTASEGTDEGRHPEPLLAHVEEIQRRIAFDLHSLPMHKLKMAKMFVDQLEKLSGASHVTNELRSKIQEALEDIGKVVANSFGCGLIGATGAMPPGKKWP